MKTSTTDDRSLPSFDVAKVRIDQIHLAQPLDRPTSFHHKLPYAVFRSRSEFLEAQMLFENIMPSQRPCCKETADIQVVARTTRVLLARAKSFKSAESCKRAQQQKKMPKLTEVTQTVPDSLFCVRFHCENEELSSSLSSAPLLLKGQRHECSVSSAIFDVVKGFASVVVVPHVAKPLLSHASDNCFFTDDCWEL